MRSIIAVFANRDAQVWPKLAVQRKQTFRIAFSVSRSITIFRRYFHPVEVDLRSSHCVAVFVHNLPVKFNRSLPLG